MLNLYVVTPELEEKIIAKAKDKSYNGEAVQVHWHSDKFFCEAKFDHAVYKNGFANKGGSGQA